MTNPMIHIYAVLVKKGVKKLEDVSEKLRASVKRWLQESNTQDDPGSSIFTVIGGDF